MLHACHGAVVTASQQLPYDIAYASASASSLQYHHQLLPADAMMNAILNNHVYVVNLATVRIVACLQKRIGN